HPGRRIGVRRPLECADEDAREAREAEPAEPVDPPLPAEAAHDPFQMAHGEPRALELRDELVAPPELVVDRVAAAALAVGAGDVAVLRVEHEMPAGPEDATELRVEALPGRRLEAAYEADAEDEVEGAGGEGKGEPVAAHEV